MKGNRALSASGIVRWLLSSVELAMALLAAS